MRGQVDDGGDGTSHEIVRGIPRVVAGVATFAAGIVVGAFAFGLDTSDLTEPPPGEIVGIGCGVVSLVVDVDDLPGRAYALRASVGPRMLPMINSMTHPLIGGHEGHQLLVPDDGRLLVVAHVPAGTGDAPRWALVGGDGDPVMSGVLPDTCAPTS